MPQEVQSRQRRAVEREGRRRRRRERRERGEGRREGETEEHRQGMSTDDELLEMNRLKFENSMSELFSLSPSPLHPSSPLTLPRTSPSQSTISTR